MHCYPKSQPLEIRDDLSCCDYELDMHAPIDVQAELSDNLLDESHGSFDDYDSDDQMLAAVQMMEEMHEDEDNQLLASLEIIEEMSSDESEVQSQYHVNTEPDDDPPSMPHTECALSTDTVNEYLCKSKYVGPITKEQQELNSRIAYFESHQEKT